MFALPLLCFPVELTIVCLGRTGVGVDRRVSHTVIQHGSAGRPRLHRRAPLPRSSPGTQSVRWTSALPRPDPREKMVMHGVLAGAAGLKSGVLRAR